MIVYVYSPNNIPDNFCKNISNILWHVAGPRTKGHKQGNRLSRHPCKGDKLEIEIFEAKGHNVAMCGTCQKIFATWTFMSIGKRVTQVQKLTVRLRGESMYKIIRNLMEFLIFKFPMQTSPRSSIKHQGPVFYSSRTLSPPPPHPPVLTIREHVQHVNYVTHLAGALRHPNPKFNSWTLEPSFSQPPSLKFATVPGDREWHISK